MFASRLPSGGFFFNPEFGSLLYPFFHINNRLNCSFLLIAMNPIPGLLADQDSIRSYDRFLLIFKLEGVHKLFEDSIVVIYSHELFCPWSKSKYRNHYTSMPFTRKLPPHLSCFYISASKG